MQVSQPGAADQMFLQMVPVLVGSKTGLSFLSGPFAAVEFSVGEGQASQVVLQ